MDPAQNYILDLEGRQATLFQYLHDLFMNYPEVHSKVRYKIPFYFRKSWICYLNPIKKGEGVELCFTRANELSNEQGALDFKDRKQIAGISYFELEAIDEKLIREIFEEALLLDEEVPYAAKRK